MALILRTRTQMWTMLAWLYLTMGLHKIILLYKIDDPLFLVPQNVYQINPRVCIETEYKAPPIKSCDRHLAEMIDRSQIAFQIGPASFLYRWPSVQHHFDIDVDTT